MREIENIASALFDKIRTRFDNVSLGDENSKATTDPEKARFINFDYTADGKKVGNITLSLIDEKNLKVYYSTDMVDRIKAIDDQSALGEDDALGQETPGENEEQHWYSFLQGLRGFAKRNIMGFDARDITKSNLQLKDIKQQSKSDNTLGAEEITVAESRMFGTSRSSYQECGPVRIIVRHSDNVDETKRGARTRNVDAVFVETHLGERFLLPFKNLHGARAMAQHCSQGGRVEDELGEGICGMVSEMDAMRHFVREAKRRQFEDNETSAMAHAAVQHYGELKNQLRHIGGRRGYDSYRECYMPTGDIEEDVDIASLRERFVKKVYNDRFDEALPYVYRAYKNQKAREATPMAEEFESWINDVSESTWAAPDDDMDVKELDQIMSQPTLRVGDHGDDAIGQLYDTIGDDELYDKIAARAAEEGPDADCRMDVVEWLHDHGYPDLAEKYNPQYTQDQQPLQAQDQAVAQQQADINAQNQPYGAAGTADPSPAVNPANEDTDPLDFIRSLAGIKK